MVNVIKFPSRMQFSNLILGKNKAGMKIIEELADQML